MKDTRFALALSRLDGWQLNRFYERIVSDYQHKQNNRPYLLMRSIKSHFGTNFRSNQLSTEKLMAKKSLAQKIKTKAAYNKTIHLLLKDLEDFVVVEKALSDEYYKGRALANWYADHNDLNNAEKISDQVLKEISDHGEEHWMNYRMSMDSLHRDVFNNEKFLASERALDLAYFQDKLMYAVGLASRYQSRGILDQLPARLIEQVSFLERQINCEKAVIKINLLIFKGITDQSKSDNILVAVDLLEKSTTEIENSKRREIATLILNFYASKLQQNEWQYAFAYMQMIDSLTRSGLLLEHNGSMMFTRYANVVRILSQGEDVQATADWLDNFIERYATKLPKRFQKYLPQFCRATVLMRLRKQLEEADDILREIRPITTVQKILHRREMVVLYFLRTAEQKSFMSLLESSIRNFDHFVRSQRNELSAPYYRVFLSYVPAYKKLARCYFGPAEKINAFIDWLGSEKPPDTPWLKSQAESRLTSRLEKY